MIFHWDPEKNKRLHAERGINFERIIVSIEEGRIRDILEHPNQTKYKNQILMLIEIDAYIWVVPAIFEGDRIFLKTAFPSRKYTAIYLPEQNG